MDRVKEDSGQTQTPMVIKNQQVPDGERTRAAEERSQGWCLGVWPQSLGGMELPPTKRLSLSRCGREGRVQDRQHLRYLTRWPSAAVKQTVKWSMRHSGERSERGQKWETPAQRQRFTSGVAGGPQEVC